MPITAADLNAPSGEPTGRMSEPPGSVSAPPSAPANSAALNAALAAYLAKPGNAGSVDGLLGWWAENAGNVNLDSPDMQVDLNLLSALADSGNQQAVQVLTQAGYEPGAPGGGSVPLEQGLLNQVLPGLTNDVNNDAARRELVARLSGTVIGATNAAGATLARTQGTGFDGAAYFAANPDVAQAYQNQGGKDGAGNAQTQDQFAEAHYLSNGKREGRAAAYKQSALLNQDYANADENVAANTAAINQSLQTQLAALAAATASSQQNLTGDLAARAAALQQQIAAMTQNLEQMDATQRAALAQQIVEMQQNLDASIATQRQALQTQIQSLQGAAGTQADAQRTALAAELQALTAAQAPMADARTRGADLQATAVNVGLERTKDQLTATAAQQGFVGGSTTQDAALARATVGARQQAAQAISDARIANASDTRDIATRGATGSRSISDALAEAQKNITGQEAGGTAGLTVAGATGRQAIGDMGAGGRASITNQTAQGRRALGDQGATSTYDTAVFGADQNRAILDALAGGTYNLTSGAAKETQAAQQAGAAAKSTYYDNDYARSLAATLAIPQIASNAAGTLTALDNYGQSGLARTQGLLNWWSTNAGAAPTPGAIAVQPNTSGNQISNLGSSLVGAGYNIGNANNWWQTPKTSTATQVGAGIGAGSRIMMP